LITSSYEVISLRDCLDEFTEGYVSDILSTFSCLKDEDVENFLKEKAIMQEKKHISRTYLIFTVGMKRELAAYFTLAVSCMDVEDVKCSNELLRKMNPRKNIVQSYLIGQLGKCDGSERGLGMLAISYASARIKEANMRVGCRVLRIDCRSPLMRYYTDAGFRFLRQNDDGTLNQMVRIISG
jgi:hypothetical protein